MTVPHVRVHVPERALTTWLLLDMSPSMTFGTADRRKADVAEGVALAIGHLADAARQPPRRPHVRRPRDRRLPPRGGRSGPARGAARSRPAVGDAAASPAGADARGSTAPARDARRGASGRSSAAATAAGGLVVLVSDFRGPRDWLRPCSAPPPAHHVLVVEIRDPREDELPDVGELTLVDAETGREVRVDTSSRALRERFAEAAAAERATLAT